MELLWIFVAFSKLVVVEGEGGCKVLHYLDCMINKTFTGHVIKTSKVLAPGLEACQHKCFLEDNCVSYNLGPEEGMTKTCELSDADHWILPGALVTKKGFEYCPIKNPCSSNPCPAGKWCTPDFLWDTFKCSGSRWTQWGGWSLCYCPQTRTRRCVTPQNTTGVCDGGDKDTKLCKAVTSINGRSEALGMQDRYEGIPDNQITASSHGWQATCSPHFGRLHFMVNERHTGVSWCTTYPGQIGDYLQIDLGSIKWMTRIATQGRGKHSHWVTEYTLSYSNDKAIWEDYKGDQDCVKQFIGNTDITTVVTHELPVPIKTRYVRVVAQKWKGVISMRVELYGCTSL